MMGYMARFALNEFVDVPADGEKQAVRNTSAFLAFIWMVNRKRPGTFGDVALEADGPHTIERYTNDGKPVARVIMGNGDREQRVDEGFRIVADDPELDDLFREVAEWIYANSFTANECVKCKAERDPNSVNYADRGETLCALHKTFKE